MKTSILLISAFLICGAAWAGDIGLSIDYDEEENIIWSVDSETILSMEMPSLDSYTFYHCNQEIVVDADVIKKMTPEETARLLQFINFLMIQYNISDSAFSPLGEELGCELTKKMFPDWLYK